MISTSLVLWKRDASASRHAKSREINARKYDFSRSMRVSRLRDYNSSECSEMSLPGIAGRARHTGGINTRCPHRYNRMRQAAASLH